ncbi:MULTISPECIES: phosphoserine transaminase [unclassified Oceanispirochaeta]|uniref:phosphoserine transaminase n=1 Tax=unclassified Oceanispirochaeta TaxID=2635722 RepID=UPI000E091071|nr:MULTISPECIES: phosphoserine transaminase [unclassified Oceanispirochaeta]MBF9015546.1 phosphoserine transaminase [Oceanispirochaeta sp. M2]NPD73965.1 phosphoserine transaminase [Oceanispirochaeta sp. M1]RDG30275.1 phosphoserine transaminase [Oceanispirochaeta sp. M1]
MGHARNFYAGPSVLPVSVLEEIQKEMVDYKGSGLSLMETSHRSPEYSEVHYNAINLFKEIFSVPDNFKVLFIGGGATMQFSMIPMNFLSDGRSCDFTLTGAWSKKAYSDAVKLGKVNVLFDGKDDNYSSLPDASTLKVSKDASYLHMTSNETIGGIQWKDWPDTGDVPIICDMSSDIMSRPIPFEKFGMIYAGAQKNLGPSGFAVVIIRDDMLEKVNPEITAYLDYRIHASKDSLYNTPPVFPIYAMSLVLQKVKDSGGLDAVVKRNAEKAALIYGAIDGSNGFYRSPVEPSIRSEMNVVFTMASEEIEKEFVAEAKKRQMYGLKGHVSVGGCRASIYNSLPLEDVVALVDFMKEFQKAKS